MDLLDNFKTIEVVTPVDKIIRQIRGLIVSGFLNPGDKLPSERKLSEKLGVGRTYIRDAIKKLEFFGVLTTHPQSGVIVNGTNISAMEGLFSNIMKIERPDFFSLVETRVNMEVFAVRSAAERRTEEDLKELEIALEAYEDKAKNNLPAENEDFLFHLKISEAAHNTVVKSMMLIILPDILAIYRKENVCAKDCRNEALEEHRTILNAIKEQDADQAALLMTNHLYKVLEFSKRIL